MSNCRRQLNPRAADKQLHVAPHSPRIQTSHSPDTSLPPSNVSHSPKAQESQRQSLRRCPGLGHQVSITDGAGWGSRGPQAYLDTSASPQGSTTRSLPSPLWWRPEPRGRQAGVYTASSPSGRRATPSPCLPLPDTLIPIHYIGFGPTTSCGLGTIIPTFHVRKLRPNR